MRNVRRIACGIALWLGTAAGTATAGSLATFDFTGVATGGKFSPGGVSIVGDQVVGQFSYDTSVAPTAINDMGNTLYVSKDFDFSFSVLDSGGHSIYDYVAGGTIYVQVFPDYYGKCYFEITCSGPPSKNAIFFLTDPSGTAFTSNALPSAFDFSKFQGNAGLAVVDQIAARVDSITAVPEPSSLCLFGAGAVVSLGYWRGRRFRRAA